MAKPSWLVVNPLSGSGNGTISNSSTAHTGRVARTGTVTVQGVGVSTPSTYQVTQTPKAEFCSFDNGSGMSAPKAGGPLTIAGKSNSSKLTFSLGTGGDISISLPGTYSANGTTTNNGTAITGDPGAIAEYPFSLALTLPANTTINEKTKNIIVTAAGGQSAQITVTQAAGDATLTVSPAAVTIPQDGSAVSVTVTSNTTWTVE